MIGHALRILFTFAGGNGHFQPLAPFARAAQSAGHTVAFAGQEKMLPVIEAAGFAAFGAGGPTLQSIPRRVELLPVDPQREDRALRDAFATRVARQRAAALLVLCASWHPDLIVCDEVDFGAMLAAEQLGIPYAAVEVMASGAFVRKEVVGEALNRLRAEAGLPADADLRMLHRYLVLSPFPPRLRSPQYPPAATTHAVRPVFHPREDPWQPAFAQKAPCIYFTLGTIFNVESGDLFERVLAGLRGLPNPVIATVGREIDPAVFGPQAENVRIERFLPQEELLPYCALTISHGGSGSVVGALAFGVPMLLLPMGADQPLNAARCVDLGVARVLDPVDCTPQTIRNAVTSLLADPTYRQNAMQLQAEIASLPGPEYALALLEQLAREKQPIRA